MNGGERVWHLPLQHQAQRMVFRQPNPLRLSPVCPPRTQRPGRPLGMEVITASGLPFFPASPRPGETPRVNPSVGLLSDGAVLGCQPWLPTACSALRSSAHSQAQLAKEARGQENRLLGWNRRERQGCWGRGRETMWLCVPAAGAVSWLFPHSHPKALPSTSTLCLGKGQALPHTLVRCGFPPPPLGWESEEEGRKEMFLIMGLQVTSS